MAAKVYRYKAMVSVAALEAWFDSPSSPEMRLKEVYEELTAMARKSGVSVQVEAVEEVTRG